jgi:hypothetical protein
MMEALIMIASHRIDLTEELFREHSGYWVAQGPER